MKRLGKLLLALTFMFMFSSVSIFAKPGVGKAQPNDNAIQHANDNASFYVEPVPDVPDDSDGADSGNNGGEGECNDENCEDESNNEE